MKPKCFVETSILVDIVIGQQYDLVEWLNQYDVSTSVTVLEETAYQVIIQSVTEVTGRKTIKDIKEEFVKGTARETILGRLNALVDLYQNYDVADLTRDDFSSSIEIINSCNLFSNDALIAGKCKSSGIKEIATQDNDFNDVPFLKPIKP